MKILVIPDVHLKPQMFQRASEILEAGTADRAVCLMDLPDDWDRQFDLDLYIQTFDYAIEFAEEHPDTLWCWGNHDLCYKWNRRESGYSSTAAYTVLRSLAMLEDVLQEENPIRYVQRIDHLIFSHGGIADCFIDTFVPEKKHNQVDEVIRLINNLGEEEMWNDLSPIWYRPQYSKMKPYSPEGFIQVTGHTPVKNVYMKDHVISCDVFSAYRNHEPIGTQEFAVIDSITGEFTTVS